MQAADAGSRRGQQMRAADAGSRCGQQMRAALRKSPVGGCRLLECFSFSHPILLDGARGARVVKKENKERAKRAQTFNLRWFASLARTIILRKICKFAKFASLQVSTLFFSHDIL
jgi:hypothetical protein